MDLPNFIFEKNNRYRHASHVASSYSKGMEEEARSVQPAVFDLPIEFIDYPAQIARFKGSEEGYVDVDFYSAVPPIRSLSADVRPRGDSVELGFFVFAGPAYQRVVDRTARIPGRPASTPLTYSLALPEGTYTYSLEARAGEAKAAVRKEELQVHPFPDDSLALSDLVLARTVAPRSESAAGRRDFAIRVNRVGELEYTDPFALYWEVYGLEPDDEGFAQYRVTVSVSDAEGRGVLASVVRALGSLVGGGGDDDVELVFERTAEVKGDRVPEYLELTLTSDEPGAYRVRVAIRDLRAGEEAAAERAFQRVEP